MDTRGYAFEHKRRYERPQDKRKHPQGYGADRFGKVYLRCAHKGERSRGGDSYSHIAHQRKVARREMFPPSIPVITGAAVAVGQNTQINAP